MIMTIISLIEDWGIPMKNVREWRISPRRQGGVASTMVLVVRKGRFVRITLCIKHVIAKRRRKTQFQEIGDKLAICITPSGWSCLTLVNDGGRLRRAYDRNQGPLGVVLVSGVFNQDMMKERINGSGVGFKQRLRVNE